MSQFPPNYLFNNPFFLSTDLGANLFFCFCFFSWKLTDWQFCREERLEIEMSGKIYCYNPERNKNLTKDSSMRVGGMDREEYQI